MKATTNEPKNDPENGGGYRSFYRGLRFKLLLLVFGISLIIMLSSTFLLFYFQRQQVIDNIQSSSLALSNTIEANLQHAMITRDPTMVNEILRAVVAEQTVDMLRILDAQGIVRASSIPGEIGSQFDRNEAACQFCHEESLPPGNKTIIHTSNSDSQVLLNVNVIQSDSRCLTCHSIEKEILGYLMLETPLTEVNENFTTGFRRIALLELAAFTLLIVLILLVLNRYVIHPIQELSKGVAEITEGNLDYRVQVISNDELGQLSKSFDGMRQQLKSSYAEKERSEQEAMNLYRMGTKISTSVTLNEVLETVAKLACELLDADVGLVGLVDEKQQEVEIKAASGKRANTLKGMRIPVGEQTPGRALVEGKSIIATTNDPGQSNFHHVGSFADEQIVSFLVVPLQRGESFIGLIEVMSWQRRLFLEHDSKLLMRLAHHVVVAIENARLSRQLRHIAALEEQSRLAREMHDNLAQTLGYLKVKASIIDDLLSRGQINQAHDGLQEFKKVTNVVYTDVREGIFNLRTAASPRVKLLPALQDYLIEYQTHYDMEIHMVIEDDDSCEFSPEVANQLLRIIQEALFNVRKHAGASSVLVRCRHDYDQVWITIEDDGRGFDLDQITGAEGQRYGLQIMRERAESVGGHIMIHALPGQGTRVIAQAPILLKE
jgi:nitrate/nitrite-specific signal transduction histidine kinase